MNILKEIITNLNNTSKLKQRYKITTLAVGMLGAFSGTALGILARPWMAALFDVNPEYRSGGQEGGSLFALTWVVLILLLMVVCVWFFAGMLMLVLYKKGRVTKQEARAYVFISRYPRGWFADAEFGKPRKD